MNNYWLYVFQSGIALWMLYAVYWLLLRKETFFSLNRFILLGSAGLSFILPLIRLENLFTLSSGTSIPSFFMDFGSEVSAPAETSSRHADVINMITNTALLVYISGVMFLGSRLVYQMVRLLRMGSKYPGIIRDGMRIVFINDEIAPCSFFNYIFINRSMQSDEEIEKIVLHEKAHVNNMHFIDLVFIELATVFQWFNPVIWLFGRSIREIHEYEADREVLRQQPDRIRYQAMLVNQAAGIEVFKLANSFSKSITKKRMIMMSKIKSAKLSSAKVLFILPVILGLVFAFSKPEIIKESAGSLQPKVVTGKVTDAESAKVLCCVAIVIEGTTEGTVTGEDGKYKIELAGGDKFLVFSHVGYETQRIKADKPEINVKMQKKVYDLPGDEALKPGKEITGGSDNEKYVMVEEMPSFQGKGELGFREYIAQNLIYPEEAKKNGITGKVFVQFTVNTKGEVVDVKVVRGVSPLLDKEAVRVTESSPLWQPGKQQGKPVDVIFTFPINFTLDGKK